MTAYRQAQRPASVGTFSTHISIAAELVEQFIELPARMSGASEDQIRDLHQEARTVWENLWDQLRQARDLAVALDRDVSSYDAARTAAGDIWQNAVEVTVGPWEPTFNGKRRTVTWRSAPLGPVKRAVDALLDAVPEAEIVHHAPPDDIELRSGYKWLSSYGAIIAVVAIIGYVVYRFTR